MKRRCNFYIDGFNWYHRLDAYQKATSECYKWLNYKSLCDSFLRLDQELQEIFFFTAMTDHYGQGAAERHVKYVNALNAFGIKVVRGNFKKKTEKDGHITLEEKQTDSNIVAYTLRDAFLNKVDDLFILSADTDMVPIVKMVKQEDSLKDKRVIIIPPPFRDSYKNQDYHQKNYFPCHKTNELKDSGASVIPVRFDKLRSHILPPEINHQGSTILIPREYLH
jgi:uncharacterized LabA/DUF88 family protein